MESIPLVKIDPDGTYKYVQISYNNKIYYKENNNYNFHICILINRVYITKAFLLFLKYIKINYFIF